MKNLETCSYSLRFFRLYIVIFIFVLAQDETKVLLKSKKKILSRCVTEKGSNEGEICQTEFLIRGTLIPDQTAKHS